MISRNTACAVSHCGHTTVMKQRTLGLGVEDEHVQGMIQRVTRGRTDLRRTQTQDTADCCPRTT